MILEKGNMWDVFGKTDMFCITTNATIKKNGALVMGRGIARQARDKLLGIDREAGKIIADLYDYYLVRIGVYGDQNVFAFQVKHEYYNKAELDLIRRSSYKLFGKILFYGIERVDLNFPGIGNGGLPREEVLPIISLLPDIVHVWELK